MTQPMTSSRAYLLRALNEWILDNGCTPYILVDAEGDQVQVPLEFVQNGKIVLNISPAAVRRLEITNEALSLDARFGGRSQLVYVPVESILAVYAKENGEGMVFGSKGDGIPPEPPPGAKTAKTVKSSKPTSLKPRLKVVK